MPLDITTLGIGTLAQATTLSLSSHLLYKPSATAPKKTAIVHGMRFTNVGSAAAKVQLFFVKNGGTAGTDERRILPKDFTVPVGYTIIDDDQVTLDSGDGLYAFADTASTMDFAVSGSERPA